MDDNLQLSSRMKSIAGNYLPLPIVILKNPFSIWTLPLFPESQPANQFLVPLDIVMTQIIKKPLAPADHLQKTSAAGMILLGCLKVFVEFGDAFGENRYLYFR